MELCLTELVWALKCFCQCLQNLRIVMYVASLPIFSLSQRAHLNPTGQNTYMDQRSRRHILKIPAIARLRKLWFAPLHASLWHCDIRPLHVLDNVVVCILAGSPPPVTTWKLIRPSRFGIPARFGWVKGGSLSIIAERVNSESNVSRHKKPTKSKSRKQLDIAYVIL